MKPRILVPFDFSDAAASALAWAADLQRSTKAEAPIHLIHVVSSFPFGDPMSAVEMLLPTPEEERTLERQLTEAALKAGANAVVDVIIKPLAIGETVVAVTEELHAELVVMGTHGRTGVPRLFLGSVAEHVTRHAPCPVVTMRAGPLSARM